MNINYTPIIQAEWGMTCATADKSVLVTGSVGPCFVLTCYDPARKIAALAHIDANTSMESVANIINTFVGKGSSASQLEVNIFGGWSTIVPSCINLHNICVTLKAAGIENPNTSYTFKKTGDQWKKIELDATTGKVKIFSNSKFNIMQECRDRFLAFCTECETLQSQGVDTRPLKLFCDYTS